MIPARIARHQAESAPRRDLVARLLLTGVEYTNARPWLGFVGMAACWVLGALLEQL